MKKILFFFLFISSFIFASNNMNTTVINTQDRIIKGIVTDSLNNESLCGVKINLINNTTKESIVYYTDLDGKYNLTIKNNNNYILVINYISYKSQEKKISTSNKDIDIKISQL